MELVPPILHGIISYLQPMGNKRTARSVFGKLILASSAYFIWMEHHHRTFKNTRRSPEEVRDLIMVTVRLKLITLRFKDTTMEDFGSLGCSRQKGQARVVLFFPSL
nr:reverse transcriptase domain, reverse transcriptase zinc-binding domain protein [Tanacetum cinerariifolium]